MEDFARKNIQLFNAIYGDDEVGKAVASEMQKNYAKLRAASRKLLSGKWISLSRKQPIFILAAVALSLVEARENFAKIGASDQIFFDTMSDIRVWGEDYRQHNAGKVGLTEINWISLHISGQIFKIGRLQYQLSRYFFEGVTRTHGKTIKFGEPLFNLHIPRGERLDMDSVTRSLQEATRILPQLFPAVRTDVMMCYSWLLCSKNAAFVAADGNIAKFAAMFEVVGETAGAAEHFRWIFDMNNSNKVYNKNKRRTGCYWDMQGYTPKTRLQEAAKQYVMSGGEFSDGKGLLVLEGDFYA